MIEIIPNWHPIFVHFTVALLSLTVVFHILLALFPEKGISRDLECLSRWCLRLGTAFAILTALTGWFAYNSVAHDAPSHAAMTEHRNWALTTLGMFILLTLWTLWKQQIKGVAGVVFLLGLLAGGGLLLATAWHGGELVYRYGLGVMSLPQPGAHHHHEGEQHVHALVDDHGDEDHHDDSHTH